jgi:hypothetical protein
MYDFLVLADDSLVVVVVFITNTCTVNGGHWVPPGGLQAYSLPQPWLCRAVREGFRGPDLEILGTGSWTLGGQGEQSSMG